MSGAKTQRHKNLMPLPLYSDFLLELIMDQADLESREHVDRICYARLTAESLLADGMQEDTRMRIKEKKSKPKINK